MVAAGDSSARLFRLDAATAVLPLLRVNTSVKSPEAEGTFVPQAVRLHVAGGDLLLGGSFEQWVPVLMEARDDGNTVQLLVDVTSLPARAGASSAPPLLTFRSRRVKPVDRFTHEARGKLSWAEGSRDIGVVIQTPNEHTPFALLTMQLPPGACPDLWEAFEARAARPRQDDGSEVRARAWLRQPRVAAA